jgi:GNAT superfamily N-acetyltransferase
LWHDRAALPSAWEVDVKIRRATVEDAQVVAGIHVRGWQWGYRGLMPDTFLAGLSVEAREPSWREQLAPDHAWHTYVAEADGKTLGFVTCGATRDPALPAASGEVYALYQEEWSAGTGVGRALLSEALTDLKTRGVTAVFLWVLTNNVRARRFYALAGFAPDGAAKEDHRPDHVRHQVRYWKPLL